MSKFYDIINSSNPTLVDFYATWCGPCKMMAPILESTAKKLEGKAKIIKIDVDKNQALAGRYNIRSVPTLMLFKNGDVVWSQPGVLQEHQIIDTVNQFSS